MDAAGAARQLTAEERARADRWEAILTGETMRGLAGEALWRQIRRDTIFTCTETVRMVAQRYEGPARRALRDAITELMDLEHEYRDADEPA